MARLSRSESKAHTRDRLVTEAKRLFAERGYAATSLEQIAQAADVTKGAIYGHFESKEDLLLSAIEGAPTPDYSQLVDVSRPLRERLEEFGRASADDEHAEDQRQFAAWLEFVAALLRNDEARARFGADLLRRLDELAAADPEEPVEGTTPIDAWSIGTALGLGLHLLGSLVPEACDVELRAKAMALLAGLYPDPET
ncbi:MAG: TetR family transcriptional regulator [Acidimicrobiales bacterium]